MRIRPALAALYWRVSRWSPRVGADLPTRGVVIGVPHTSNWDFVLMVMVSWTMRVQFRFLAKKSVFWEPLGSMMRALGGIPVDRNLDTGLVRQVEELTKDEGPFLVVITPEATRGKVEFWKSGFYRIAYASGLPVLFGFIDRRTMTCGILGHIQLTGDVTADMDVLRKRYAGHVGVNPGQESVPRLRDESGTPDR